jgi:hypothetical protein
MNTEVKFGSTEERHLAPKKKKQKKKKAWWCSACSSNLVSQVHSREANLQQPRRIQSTPLNKNGALI